ncbi:MAG: hypothetical protein IPM59_02470 [Chloracidobacterium sp.]|nr:hypothetical protein [Chloracidobacterium sp.]
MHTGEEVAVKVQQDES